MRALPSGIAALSFLTSCASGAGLGDSGGQASCSSATVQSDAAVAGKLYYDSDGQDRSTYESGFEKDNDEPIAAVPLRLLHADGEMEASSCQDGSYAFNGLSDGVHLVVPDPVDGDCLQKNCARRFPEAVAEGQVKIVTMGDSVAVVGSKPLFPKRVKSLFSDLVEIKNRNVAVGGSLSTQWVPGSSYFDTRLAPELSNADVVVMSIGGNDIVNSLDMAALQNPQKALDDLMVLIQGISDNVLETADAIKEINPDIDILYCLYVNYGNASISPWNLVNGLAPEDAVADLLSSARDSIGADEDIIMVDLFGASEQLDNLDDYLADALHFNDLGHTFYAEEIFKALGGVLIGESPLGGAPRTPLGTTQNWSFSR